MSHIAEQDLIKAIGLHERNIRAFIRGCGVYRPDDIDEVMQEVLVKAWRKLDQLQNIEDFPKWAVVIARYEVLNFRKKKARDKLMLSETAMELLSEDEEENDDIRSEQLQQLQLCLQKLNTSQRKLLEDAYRPGLLIDELAKEFGLKANAIYQKLWRIRKKLSDCIHNSLQTSS